MSLCPQRSVAEAAAKLEEMILLRQMKEKDEDEYWKATKRAVRKEEDKSLLHQGISTATSSSPNSKSKDLLRANSLASSLMTE